MKQYEELDSGGRVVCKTHGMLRCSECEYVDELEQENKWYRETLKKYAQTSYGDLAREVLGRYE